MFTQKRVSSLWQASLNYAGKKMFSVIKNENMEIIEFLLKEIEK